MPPRRGPDEVTRLKRDITTSLVGLLNDLIQTLKTREDAFYLEELLELNEGMTRNIATFVRGIEHRL